MSTLIVYATKYGSTEKCARIVAQHLNDDVDIVDIKKNSNIDISKYEKVIIGGSIYMGKIQKGISAFCSQNADKLKQKKLGLFICAMSEGEEARKVLHTSFPSVLLDIAKAKECFGGEFQIEKMGFFDKFIVKKVSKTTESKSNLYNDKMQEFAKTMNL